MARIIIRFPENNDSLIAGLHGQGKCFPQQKGTHAASLPGRRHAERTKYEDFFLPLAIFQKCPAIADHSDDFISRDGDARELRQIRVTGS